MLTARQVVDDNSSYLNFPTIETTEHIGRNHRDMCRFTGPEDSEYKKVAAALRLTPIASPLSAKGERTVSSNSTMTATEQTGRQLETISFDDFLKVELRIDRIVSASEFPEARKPAYVLHVDFGDELGIKKSSAQITALYKPENLIGKLVVAVVNFPKKQVGPLMSECLVTGFHNEQGEVALCVPDQAVPLGTRLL